MIGRWIQMAALAAVMLWAADALAQDKAKIEQGAALFTSQKCSMCHAIAGKGNAKGALDGVGAKLSETDLRAWIVDPEGMRAKANATRTPAMKKTQLTAPQVDALVAYLGTLKKP
jgi:mono/diheme cytochrome c family protein